ncbi:MAG: hypothetical protein V4731_03190 [Pseudomonadota bacterium]
MASRTTVLDIETKPLYARAKATCAHFQIARSTLWMWSKTRKEEGFPQPLKAGVKVTLFDINAIDAFLKAQAAK